MSLKTEHFVVVFECDKCTLKFLDFENLSLGNNNKNGNYDKIF